MLIPTLTYIFKIQNCHQFPWSHNLTLSGLSDNNIHEIQRHWYQSSVSPKSYTNPRSTQTKSRLTNSPDGQWTALTMSKTDPTLGETYFHRVADGTSINQLLHISISTIHGSHLNITICTAIFTTSTYKPGQLM